MERGATGKGEGEEASVVRYDGVIKAGGATVPVLMVAVTDNRNRTGASVRATFRKCEGEVRAEPSELQSSLMTTTDIPTYRHTLNNIHIRARSCYRTQLQKTGMLDYLFKEVGLVTVRCSRPGEGWTDEVMEVAVEAGAEDVKFFGLDEDGEEVEVGEEGGEGGEGGGPLTAYIDCDVADLPKVVAAARGLVPTDDGGGEDDADGVEAETRFVPESTVEVDGDEGREKLEKFLDLMDENEDVTDVFHGAA